MKITLITACYNSAGTIRTAIESALSQRGVDVEYIVVDGGSTDGTVDIIREFSTRSTCSTRLKWISEKDSGMYDAINKGIKKPRLALRAGLRAFRECCCARIFDKTEACVV